MTTNATRPGNGNRAAQLEQATALKALIGSASLALTLAGWGWLSYQQAALNTATAEPAPPAEQAGGAGEQPATTDPGAPAALDPLPTLAPLYTPNQVDDVRSGRADGGTQTVELAIAAPQTAPRPQLRAVKAPPRPVAVTRSSR